MTATQQDTGYDRIDLVYTHRDLTVHRYIWRGWMDSSWRAKGQSWRKMVIDAMPLRELADHMHRLIQSSEEFREQVEFDPIFGFTAHSASYFEHAERGALTSQPIVPVPQTLMDGIKAELRDRRNAAPDDEEVGGDMSFEDGGDVLILACASIGYTPTLRIHRTAQGTHEAHIYNRSTGWHELEARGAIDLSDHGASVRAVMALWDCTQ